MATKAAGSGTKDKPWTLKTPSGNSEYVMYRADDADPPAHAVFCGADRILVTDGPTRNTQGEFLRDASDRIAWLRIGGRIHRRV